ncbi:MAG: HAD-IA family hydrolase, partial [Saprospiraceae bacterium]|nr:HAD-IA family hydrolase [Saprospiraceae bacterium]
MEISNLLFDIGNVLLDLDLPGTRKRFSALRKKSTSVEHFFNSIRPIVHAYEKGEIPTETFVEQILSHCQPATDSADIVEIWNDMLLTIPAYRLGMLMALRERFNLFVVSNTNALHLERFHDYLVTSHDITDFEAEYFDEVYYSHQLGMRKPEPAIYRHIVVDALITPARTLYIDDSEECIAAAKKLGFQ